VENARTVEHDTLPKEASGTSDQEALRRTAIHEAGHALAACSMKRKFRFVTINPDPERDSLGHILHSKQTVSRCRDLIYGSSHWWWRRMETEKEIIMRLAGGIAQAIVFGDHESNGPDDFGRMMDGGTWGRELLFVEELAEKLVGSREEALVFMRWLTIRTHDMLLFPIHRVLLDVIANELLAHKTLKSSQVRRIISTAERYVRKEIRKKKKEEIRKKKNARDTKSDDLTLEERWARFTDNLATGARRTLEAKYSKSQDHSDSQSCQEEDHG
jgi:hypothetical protein